MPLIDPLLVLRDLAGACDGLAALEGMDLDVQEGDIIGICGDKGAGKSTLVRLLAGVARPSAGMIVFEGSRLWRHTPHESLTAGIVTLHQGLALVPAMSAVENVFLGHELLNGLGLLDRRAMRREARALLDDLGLSERDMDRPVSELSPSARRAVALARAMRLQPQLIVLDEPMAGLDAAEALAVLDLIRRLAADGVTLLVVSQSIADTLAVARRIVVLKAGRKVGEAPAAAFTPTSLAEAVATGRMPDLAEPPPAADDRWVEVPPRLVRHQVDR